MTDRGHKMDEQLEKRVADLAAHNDETGDGRLDAADLKAQLNRLEAQLELQDQQNRRIMRNQRLRMIMSIAITILLLVALGAFWYYSHIALNAVLDGLPALMDNVEQMQERLESLGALFGNLGDLFRS